MTACSDQRLFFPLCVLQHLHFSRSETELSPARLFPKISRRRIWCNTRSSSVSHHGIDVRNMRPKRTSALRFHSPFSTWRNGALMHTMGNRHTSLSLGAPSRTQYTHLPRYDAGDGLLLGSYRRPHPPGRGKGGRRPSRAVPGLSRQEHARPRLDVRNESSHYSRRACIGLGTHATARGCKTFLLSSGRRGGDGNDADPI